MSSNSGFFGPDSMSRRIHRDASSILGAGRALLIQALDPHVMAVFQKNSDYRDDPWGRLRRTGGYFGDVIYGDSDRAMAASRRVRKLHASLLPFEDPMDGRMYRADDPDLLLWVHTVAVDSFLASYRRYGGGLSRADGDRYVREMVAAAELIGLTPDGVPTDEAELQDYLDDISGLALTPGAREGMNMILLDPPIPAALRPLYGVVSAAVISLLPEKARSLYGLRWFSPIDLPLRPTVFVACRAFNAWNRLRHREGHAES